MQAGRDRALTSAGNCGPGSGPEGNVARERGTGRLAELSLSLASIMKNLETEDR
jgi:hypothetical protein